MRRSEKPATKAGQIRALWPEIEAALAVGQTMKTICAWLAEDAGITLSVTSISMQADELPLTVRDPATYLGGSPQTVYLWVGRKQIPHLRVMGRNIRFLKSRTIPKDRLHKQIILLQLE